MGLAQKAGALLVRAGKFLSHCLCCCTGSCPTGVSECSPHCYCTGGTCQPCRETACPNGNECAPGCACVGGQCVGCRETACPNGDECAPGCACVGGECVDPCEQEGCYCQNTEFWDLGQELFDELHAPCTVTAVTTTGDCWEAGGAERGDGSGRDGFCEGFYPNGCNNCFAKYQVCCDEAPENPLP